MTRDVQAGGRLHMVGLNHHTAPTELREAFALDRDEAARWLKGALRAEGLAALGATVREAAVISTCNRTEAYLVVQAEGEGAELRGALLDLLTAARPELARLHPGAFQRREEGDAIRQLLSVAAGIDSLVVGEAQILGQVNQAYEIAKGVGAIGPILERLFQASQHTGKRARAETEIGRGSVSVASAACELAIKVVGALKKKSVLVLGTGETGSLVARHLAAEKPERILLVNRTAQRAEALAGEVGGIAVPIEELPRALKEVDVVLTATSAPEPVITRPLVQAILKQRRGALVFIDIAVPRDVDPDVHTLDGAFVYGMEALDRVVKENVARRVHEVPKVAAIVEEEQRQFMRWLASRGAGSLITELRERYEGIRQAEIARHSRGLEPAQQEVVDRVSRGLLNKMLHGPTTLLRNGASDPETLALMRRIFQLDEPKEPDTPRKEA